MILPSRIYVLCALVFFSCAGVSNSELTRAKTIAQSKEQFAANPFGFEITVDNFQHHYGNILKQEYYLITNQENELAVKIYWFHKGKTEIRITQTDRLMSADIYDTKIKLKNDIHVGLSRKEFFWKFTDWMYDSADSLTLFSADAGCTFTFVFSKDKLKSIHIENRQSQLDRLRRNLISTII
ncbi:MAG: hypothetical protein LBQ60_07820 [Bacteroidales bacterium]|jgi:hypothetical protein|nr:hypothetical protein [Bacteroidales bacterium]